MMYHTRMCRMAVAVALASLSSTTLAQLEEVIVTAQKRAESAQDVPIAVTAFDAEAMEAKQILGFSDLRFTTPNVTAAKTNFSGFNFQIRGIGRTLIAASGDSGVGIHVNEVPIVSPRLFETEYFDVQQLEVLRGPQGTLYGRNATGGTVNMTTARAEPGLLAGNLEGQYGNYDHKKITGHINIPVGDSFAMRFAGLWLEREGYTENLFLDTDVDGRDQYSLRGSFSWQGENTSADLMISYFEEDSTRARSQKTMCRNEPTGLLGCAPDGLDFDFPHPSSQLTQLLASTAVLGPFGIYEFGDNTRAFNPPDLREVYSEFDPTYESDETLVTLNITHQFDNHTLAFVGGYQDTTIESEQDYLWTVAPTDVTVSPALAGIVPINYETFWADGLLPISAASENGTGIIGGNVAYQTTGLEAYDNSWENTEQYTAELRLASDYDGKFNWLLGGFYMEVETSTRYNVLANGFDYLVLLGPVLGGADGTGWVAPQFRNQTTPYELESTALFGEIYYQFTDDVKLTVGLRYTNDEKSVRSRQLLLNTDADGNRIFQELGVDEPIPVAFDNFNDEWSETTGRVVLDWAYSADGLFYASYSRGYKGGGFNPAFDPADFPDQSTEFLPEFVDAFEIGSKNIFLDGTLQANGSIFFYDYADLQVSKIVNRTSFNENTDAQIFGVELELAWAPNENWLLNGNFAYLKTEVKDFASVDPRNPTDGRSDLTLIKDTVQASNCVADMSPEEFAATGQSQFNSCAGLTAAGFPIITGAELNLDGNQLQNSPELSFSLGGQYNHFFNGGSSLTLRLDYYWQDEMYARNFNKPVDKIDSWDVWNAQATWTSSDDRWYVRAYGKNLADEDHLVGHYLTDASSGNFTNVFAIEPRTYGLALGYNFGVQ